MTSAFFTLYLLTYFLRKIMLSNPLLIRRTWTSLFINYLIFQWVSAKFQVLRNRTFHYLFISSTKVSSWMFFFSKKRKCRRKVKLLLLIDLDKNHSSLIENFSNLMHHLTRSSSKTVGGPRTRFCGNCMQPIVKHNFSNHVQFCEHHKPLEIKMPDNVKKLTFENWQ